MALILCTLVLANITTSVTVLRLCLIGGLVAAVTFLFIVEA